MLEIRDLTKIYGTDAGAMRVLDRASLSIARKEFVCLLGPSGCGKTTLLRIVVGLEAADAGALSKDPKILLMDEPFAAVDMQTRERLQEELLRIWNTTETTVLFVTHSVEEAVYLGDRVVVMAAHPGRIRADVSIDLPRPRYATDVKASPRFGELCGQLREQLREEKGAAKV